MVAGNICRMAITQELDHKNNELIRDGPLEKLWEWGIFDPQEFFFVIKFLV